MGKEIFGEYAAFDSGRGIRYQKNNKLVSVNEVPEEVVSYLNNKLDVAPEPPKDKPRFPRPSEEELARMREESLKPAPGLELTPEEEARRAVTPPNEVLEHDEGDEDTPDYTDIELSESAAGDMSKYMERVSIYTAGIKDIAQALYDRFGIYTIYLNEVPQTDEINPLTGEAFTRYHQGIAYQALVKARGSGFFNRNPELAAQAVTEGRVAHENYQTAAGDPRHTDHSQPTDTNAAPDSFAYRTSPAANNEQQTHYIAHEPDPVTGEMRAVQRAIPNAAQHSGKVNNSRQRFDANQDEMIVEPQFGQQVVRPDW